MHISKHNYAIELENQGNRVYFMNPPNQDQNVKDYVIRKIDGFRSLYLIDVYLFNNRVIDYLRLRLKITQLYDWYLFKMVKRICRNEQLNPDQVWSFDPNLHGFLHKYPAQKKIYFVADQVQHGSQRRGAKKADLIVAVASELLDPFRKINPHCLLINHGLNRSYEKFADTMLQQLLMNSDVARPATRLQAGYIGNLLIPSLYREGLKQIVTVHPDIDFHFWGIYNAEKNNLLATGEEPAMEVLSYIQANCKNTFFYGVKPADEIIRELDKIDLFVYINDSVKDINGGANSHKILEYLSSGKVVVSTWLSFYGKEDLFVFTKKGREKDFAGLFDKVVRHIETYNTKEMAVKRIQYALSNTYSRNIDKVNAALAAM